MNPIILLGVQGSGKGTQAKVLSHVFDIPYIEAGGLLRRHLSEGTRYAPQIEPILRGEYVRDDVVNEVVGEEVRGHISSGKSFVLDGFPRSLQQAVFLASVLKEATILNLEITEDEAVKRLSSRRLCRDCGSPLQPSESACQCGCTAVVTREDDTPEGIRRRLELNKINSGPTEDFLRRVPGYSYLSVDAMRQQRDVTSELMRLLSP